MEAQRTAPPPFAAPAPQQQHQYHDPQQLPAFPAVPTAPIRYAPMDMNSPTSTTTSPKDAMNIDNLVSPQSRPQRASSVTSGMSLEDLQAAETLEFLKHGSTTTDSPRAPGATPPQWVASQSEYSANQQEPLLHLLTSQVPLVGAAVNSSMYAYSQTKSYSPVIRYPAEFIERNIGNPVADTIGAVGRRTGVEGGLRWALQGSSKKRKITNEAGPPAKKEEMDMERGISIPGRERRESMASETLPLYDEAGRSPPYQADPQNEEERMLVLQKHQNQQPPPGWQTRLIVTTSGLGVAMSEQSRSNLKYCLSWLKWANERLAGVIVAVTNLLKQWEEGPQEGEGSKEQQKAALTARIQALSQDVAETVKKVVVEVSKYAGGALPNNARELVHRYFNSLPHRWRYATTLADTNAEKQHENETVSNGRRVLALAREGLTMMSQVTVVVNDTLVSAENWCEKLGRQGNRNDEKAGGGPSSMRQQQYIANPSTTASITTTENGDIKMENTSDYDTNSNKGSWEQWDEKREYPQQHQQQQQQQYPLHQPQHQYQR